jgi:hypothetical protein
MKFKFISAAFCVTSNAHNTFTELEIKLQLTRHLCGDWGDLSKSDKKANDVALTTGDRILSAYNIGTRRMWIITDAEDDNGVRNYTTVLLPEDY